MQKIRAYISLKAIYNNATALKTVSGTRLCAVVKANAYGHGAPQVAYALHTVADCFAVSLLDEAKAIRVAACGRDILILTPPLTKQDVLECILNGFILTVADIPSAKLVASVAENARLPARVHLKVNTGMNRYGMDDKGFQEVCKRYTVNPYVRVEGVYSHLYQTERKTCEKQRLVFLNKLDVCKRFFPNARAHLSATYGALLGREFAFDMVRIGIGLYGYIPDGAQDMDKQIVRALALKRAMKLTATSMGSRDYRYGGAGYGKPIWQGTQQPPKRLFVCRVGYADGVLRNRKNGLNVWRRQANNACMDASVLIGAKGRGKEICIMDDAAKTARQTGTISYEVLCAATRRAECIYDER
ncbi:MAG: alanine racemase [Clostridia bacterium]|nr:alanine racemase [Clostridia bacterium]